MARARAGKTSIPDKLYFKIGEVAKIVGVATSVLRYWETEFSVLKPGKTRARHRLYRRRDVEMLLEIKRLLHDERFTIAGARKRLKATPPARKPPRPAAVRTGEPTALELTTQAYRVVLARIKGELQALYDRLR